MVLKKGPRRRHKEGLEKHMQKVFEFNDDQMNKFIDYRDLHRERGEEISKQLLAVSKSYYILDCIFYNVISTDIHEDFSSDVLSRTTSE